MTGPDPEKLAFYLLKSISKVQRLYRLFEAGDRIAVAVSGGKDSAALLELLRRWQGRPVYTLHALHAQAPHGTCGDHVEPAELGAWAERLGVPLEVVLQEAPSAPPSRRRQSPCFHCAWRRRKALFIAARAAGCNKIALAHHADDVAVTTLLNLVYQGRCETMSARIALFDGELTLIRPLYFIEEREIVRFVRSGILPFEPATCCRRGADARRARMREILRALEQENPRVKRSLLNAAGAIG